MENIAKKLRDASTSPYVIVYYGNIKKNEDVRKALTMFKNLKIDVLFK